MRANLFEHIEVFYNRKRCHGYFGNVISESTNELIIPNYKNVWADIRKIGRVPGADTISFKALEYPQDV